MLDIKDFPSRFVFTKREEFIILLSWRELGEVIFFLNRDERAILTFEGFKERFANYKLLQQKTVKILYHNDAMYFIPLRLIDL